MINFSDLMTPYNFLLLVLVMAAVAVYMLVKINRSKKE